MKTYFLNGTQTSEEEINSLLLENKIKLAKAPTYLSAFYVSRSQEEIELINNRQNESYLNNLRELRQKECYDLLKEVIIDKNGNAILKIDTLNSTQKIELAKWVQEWRDITITLKMPVTPDFMTTTVSSSISSTPSANNIIYTSAELINLPSDLTELIILSEELIELIDVSYIPETVISIKVPSNLILTYQSASNWCLFADKIEEYK